MDTALNVALSPNPDEAMRQLCAIAGDLVAVLKEEGAALDSEDFQAFRAAQERKAALARAHEETARQFQDCAESFRGIDRASLDRLEVLQKEIGIIGKENLVKIKALQKNDVSANPLLWAQESGE